MRPTRAFFKGKSAKADGCDRIDAVILLCPMLEVPHLTGAADRPDGGQIDLGNDPGRVIGQPLGDDPVRGQASIGW